MRRRPAAEAVPISVPARPWERRPEAPGAVSFMTGLEVAAERRLRALRRPAVGGSGLVIGDDTTDRRQNLLHRGLLDLCRLRISDSTSSRQILHQPQPICRFEIAVGNFMKRPDLSPDQSTPAQRRALSPVMTPDHDGRSTDMRRDQLRCLDKLRHGSNASKARPRCENREAVTDRRACARRPNCRAPDDSARWSRRFRSAGSSRSATAGRPLIFE